MHKQDKALIGAARNAYDVGCETGAEVEQKRVLEWVDALTDSRGQVSAHWLRDAILSGNVVERVES
jgi:hypothetical protein